MPFNEELPNWQNEGTEPPESKKAAGFLPGEKPPADWFNWLFARLSKVVAEIRLKSAMKEDIDAHKNAAILDHPDGSVTTNKIAAKAITQGRIADKAVGAGQIADAAISDTAIGNRTATDSVTPSLTGTLTALLSSIFTLIKGITGKASVLTAPAITLEAAKTSIDALKTAQSEAASIPATIRRGLNVISTSQASPAELTFGGRTLVNLLGKDGNCEDVSKWEVSAVTCALDALNAKYGKYSFKITSQAITGGVVYKGNIPVISGKYYLAAADFNNGNTNYAYIIANGVTGQSVFGQQYNTSYAKFIASDNDTDIELVINGGVGQFAVVDGVRLYEISASDYSKIGVDLEYTGDKLAEKFPYVDSVQHLQTPAISKKGKNLLPPFTQWELHANVAVTEPYKMTLNAQAPYQGAKIVTPVVDGQSYTLKNNSATGKLFLYKKNSTAGLDNLTTVLPGVSYTFTANSTYLGLCTINASHDVVGVYSFADIQLELGNVVTQFEPQNDDYMYLPTVLASNIDGSIRDTYNSALGTVTRRWKTDVTLDGSFAWAFDTDYVGYKRVKLPAGSFTGPVESSQVAVKYDGSILLKANSWNSAGQMNIGVNGDLYTTIADTDSGWGETYTPTAAEVAAYFNGWKMNNGTLGTPYNGTGTKRWSPINWNPKATFLGKVTGDNTDNPHKFSAAAATFLMAPSNGSWIERTPPQYAAVAELGGSTHVTIASVNGQFAEQIAQIDIIEHVIRNYGVEQFGTAVTTAERVAWLKAGNINKLTFNSYVTGSGPAGNKAYIAAWLADLGTPAWGGTVSHTNSAITMLSISIATSRIDSNGFVYLLSYADASNGTISSRIETDFINLEVEFNPDVLPTTRSYQTYEPYKLNYQLAKSIEEPIITDGAIALHNGGNQIELLEGVVVREKTKPIIYAPTQRYYINNITPEVFSTRLINRTNNILSVYRNGVLDNKWTIRKDWSLGYGGSDASIPASDFDVSAEYTVTYIMMDKYSQTSNVIDATLTYQSTLGGTVAKNTQDIADIKTHNSVQDWKLLLDEAYALNTRFDLYGHIGSRGFSHAIATQTEAGFQSFPDKIKIDGIAAGAGTAGSATDTVIGTRTINDAIAIGTTDTDTPTNLFSKIGAMIRAITGKADWWSLPVKSLEALNTDKVDKVAGKQLSTEDYTTAEKTKLSGVAANANNYTHPANHPPSIITQDASNRFVTDAEKTTWNAKAAQTDVGTISTLLTSNKSNTVAAINELFTSASNGKTAVAAAITGKGVPASGADTFAQLATKINAIQDWVYNSGNVVQAKSDGRYTYATSPTTVSVLEITKGGTFKIEFGLSTNNVAYIAYAQIYKNEVPYGTLRSSSEWQTPLVFSEELSYSTGDKVQIKAWVDRTDGLSNVINIVVKSSLQIPYFSF